MKVSILLMFFLFLFSCTEQEEQLLQSSKNLGIKTDHQLSRSILEKHALLKNKICWVGDSITEQGIVGHGNDVGFTTYVEQSYPGANYLYSAVGGHTTNDVISRLEYTKSLSANLYIVAIGINDVRKTTGALTAEQYLANMQTIITSLAESGADVVVISIFPSFWSDQSSHRTMADTETTIDMWNAGLKILCANNGFLYIDATPAIKKRVKHYNLTSLVRDGVHPNYNQLEGKKLYADAILYGDSIKFDYGDKVIPSGSNFYKLVILDNGKNDFVGLKNLRADVPLNDLIAFARASTYTDPSRLLLPFDSSYSGILNTSNDAPLILFFSSETPLNELLSSGHIGYASRERGIRSYKLYHCDVAECFGDNEHESWNLISSEDSNIGNAVSLIPRNRPGIYYQLRIFNSKNAMDKIKISKIGCDVPIRVWQQNLLIESQRDYPSIFSTGSDLNPLIGGNVNISLQWEVEADLSSIDLQSLDDSIGDWKLYRTTNPSALTNPSHLSWSELASGSGQRVISLN